MSSFTQDLIRLNSFSADIAGEAAVESEVLLPDYFPNILRLIRTEAVPFIRAKTLRGDRYTVEGHVEFRILYLAENDMSIRSVIQCIPFTHSFDGKISDTAVVNITPRISYANARALSPQKLYIKASIDLQAHITDQTDFKIIIPPEEDSGLYAKKAFAENYAVTCKGEKPLKVSDELSLEGKSASQILRYEISFTETDQKLLSNKIITKADMFLKIIYIDEKTGEPASIDQRVGISQILDLDGLDEETTCVVNYSTADCKISLREGTEDVSHVIVYDIDINVSVIGYKNIKYSVCVDAFSSFNNINCHTKQMKTGKFIKVSKELSFRQTIDIGLYDKIFDISATPSVLTVSFEQESSSLAVSGTFSCMVLFRDAEGDFNSVDKVLPFSVQIPIQEAITSMRANSDITTTALAFITNDSASAELRIDCIYKAVVFAVSELPVLTDIEILEQRKEMEKSLILYFAEKDEIIWEIAKKYAVCPDILCKNNNIEGDMINEKAMLII